MENAIDTMKIAFSMSVYVLALALTVSVVGQARATSEVVFHSNDKTEFYQYITNENIANTKDRVVGIETVIPTIHRYAKEQFAVTIFDRLGNPIVRYDLWTEGFMSNWNQILKNKDKQDSAENSAEKESYEEVSNRLKVVQQQAYKTLNIPEKEFDVEKMIRDLYTVKSYANSSITIGAPWVGDNEKITQRIKADMLGENFTNNLITYKGKKLKDYENSKFIEKFLEITTSGETVTDESDSLETIKGNKKLEIIYILQ